MHLPRLALGVTLLGLLAYPARADVAPEGPEFQVNTYTTGYQLRPRVGADASGNFVVVWESGYYGTGPDGSDSGIAARRYDAAAVPAGPEFVVNSYTVGPQSLPSVAAAPAGDFLVAWEGGGYGNDQDGSASGVFVQRFAGGGARLGQEFRANSVTKGPQRAPAVAVGPAGDSMVVWESSFFGPGPVQGGDGSAGGIFGQRYDAGGAPVGGEFLVNTYTPGDQTSPAVAAAPGGGFVVVWRSGGYPSQDGSYSGVFGRRYDAGGNPAGGEFQVNTYTTGSQGYPAVAFDGTGKFVVVWQSSGFSPQDGSGDGVFAQRFDAGASRLGGEFQVNTHTLGSQFAPAVAADADGNFVVVWATAYGIGQEHDGDGVLGQHFASTGEPLGPEFQVNTYTPGTQRQPSVAAGPDGDFVVVWLSGASQDGDGTGIFGQRLRTAGFEPPRPAAGRRLALRSDPANPRRRRLTVRADDATIGVGAGAGSRDDPTRHGGSVRVTIGGAEHAYLLPAVHWRRVGSSSGAGGYEYRDGAQLSGPVTGVVVKAGGIRVAGKGAALEQELATNPDPVTVVVQLGTSGVRYCMVFGGATAFQPGKRYRASNAPPPASCR